jgi:hypothetical protein
MRLFSMMSLIFCGLLLFGILSPCAGADEWNEKTLVTFTGPVEVPGYKEPMVLSAGTYVFKLLDSGSDRNIVQIFNTDQTHVYTTILAIPDYRLVPTGKTVITFKERAEGSPQALKAWFYPGHLYGQEFVYPKVRAVELAKEANEPVLSMPEEAASNMAKPIKSKNEPAVAALEKTPIKAEEPTGQEVEASQVVSTKPLVAKKMPQTASDMPLAELCGALLVGLGIGLRLLSGRLA